MDMLEPDNSKVPAKNIFDNMPISSSMIVRRPTEYVTHIFVDQSVDSIR